MLDKGFLRMSLAARAWTGVLRHIIAGPLLKRQGAGALGVLPTLAVHDILELRMAGHDRPEPQILVECRWI